MLLTNVYKQVKNGVAQVLALGGSNIISVVKEVLFIMEV